MKKKFYLTVDLEEWYHLLYFEKYTKLQGQDFFMNHLDEFLNLINNENIKCTFFTLAEVALNHSELIRKLSDNGHEIACHGLNHELVSRKSLNTFESELRDAKSILEKITGKDVYGYRAPCFSIRDECIPSLKKLGFKYDSSYIRFSNHSLYGSLNLNRFIKVSNLRYSNENFKIIEVPTTKILNKRIPFSGGGYLRFIPFFLFKKIFKRELKRTDEYLLYIHPFELTEISFKIPMKVKLLDHFRFSHNRRKNIHKLKKVIKIIKEEGYSFQTIGESE